VLDQVSFGRDTRWSLGRQSQFELIKEDALISLRLGMATQDEGATVGGWEVDIEHLHGSELLDHGTRGESWGQRSQAGTQRDVETVGQEGDENVSFDAVFELMINGTKTQIALEVLEGRLDFGQLDVKLPQFGGIASTEVGAQKITGSSVFVSVNLVMSW